MKKFLSLILAFIMILGVLALSACGGADDNADNGNSDVGTGSVNGSQDDNSEGQINSDENGDESNNGGSDKIDMTKVTGMEAYHEGLSFVELNNDQTKAYCIDKEGKILFTLNTAVGTMENVGFHNGIAAFRGAESMWICDKQGNITKPEDLGGDKILIEPVLESHVSDEFFKAGYFFVKKTTTTFEGSKDEAALYNCKLEKLHDFSEELYGIYEEFLVSGCYGGYLYEYNGYEEPKIFDPVSGKKIENVTEFLANVKLENPSDLWYREGDGIYDLLGSSETPVLDLSKYSETLDTVSNFKDGVAGVTFGSGGKFFFTVMKEDGNFFFEPVELGGASYPDIKYSGGKFMVTSRKTDNYIFETFDVNGKIGSLTVNPEGNAVWFDFSDDVVVMHRIGNDKVDVYKTDFTPLF